MKIIILALILFFLQVSVAIVDILGIFQFSIATDEQWIGEIEDAQTDVYDPTSAIDVATSFGFGDFVNGFLRFRDMIFRVVNVKATMVLFGVDAAIASLVGLGAVILWILGIAQFIANRSTKGMQ